MVLVNYSKYRFFQKAEQLVPEIYKVTKSFPKDEKYGISNELKKEARNIGLNISSGAASDDIKQFRQSLEYAIRSCKKVEYNLKIAKEMEYISVNTYDRLIDFMGGITGPLIVYVNKIKESQKNE